MPGPRDTPDFSPLAERYARSRPVYPDAWFRHLASLLARRELAWDAATGNGQVAASLARHFARVIATDISAEQLRHAVSESRIEYRVAPSERSGLPAGTVDLVTVGAAAHWFDLEAFGAEVRRVCRPGAVLAVFTYHVGIVEPPFDRVFEALYRVVRPYFADEVRLVDALYETLPLPGEPVEVPTFRVTARWNLDQVVDFVHSWSGTVRYVEREGRDPVALIAPELEALWGPRDEVRELRWPLHARVSRL